MNTRESIKARALTCIDEVYSESNTAEAAFFPIEPFIDEAARWVLKTVPLRRLGLGKEFNRKGLVAQADGTGYMPLPDDYFRLIHFRLKGWKRTVFEPIYDTDPRYRQQMNPTLRGGEAKPVVAICENTRRLEYYSSARGAEAEIEQASYYGFTTVDDSYPMRLVDITAWKVAELALTVMNDVQGMQFCQARINDILPLL